MAVAHVFNNVTFVFGGTARQEVSMLAEKRLQIRRQQFTEAGCRAADVGLHKYSSTKRIHRSHAPMPNRLASLCSCQSTYGCRLWTTGQSSRQRAPAERAPGITCRRDSL